MTRLPEGTFCGHPVGLFVLFLTEMWERFSYYGMRALLIYYMMKQLMFPQTQASQIYGLYTGLVYLTPLFGGILADRAWGQRRTVIVGGVLMAIGHFLMAFESAFFPALLFLILGNGAFKPNISTQVASLYPKGDPRRDRAFSIFYVGINLGAFFSPLVCGTLAELYGWHYGFSAAGVGMVIGLLIYLSGQRWLAPDAFTESRRRLGGSTNNRTGIGLPRTPIRGRSACRTMAGRLGSTQTGRTETRRGKAGTWSGEGAGLHGKSSREGKKPNLSSVGVEEPLPKFTAEEKSRVLGLVAVCFVSVAFWAAYEQQGNTIALWADTNTDRNILGWEFPASWVQSLNPAFVFILTPMITALWAWQSGRRREPSAVSKMVIGCFLSALGFLVMIPAAGWCAAGGARVSIWWLVVFTLLVTLGELYLSPVGLSLVTKVAPARMVSMMMGVWFSSSFLGNYGAGLLGQYWEKMPKAAFFLLTAGIACAAGLAILALLRPLERAMGRELS